MDISFQGLKVSENLCSIVMSGENSNQSVSQ